MGHLVVSEGCGADHDSHEESLVPVVERVGRVDGFAGLAEDGEDDEDGDSEDGDHEAGEEALVGAVAVGVLYRNFSISSKPCEPWRARLGSPDRQLSVSVDSYDLTHASANLCQTCRGCWGQ